jgi:1-deoxy-D-xylulose-5-phosphate synthase
MLDEAIAAAEILREEGISAGVTNIAVIKPVDTSLGKHATKLAVTLEDNVLSGGFGEAFAVNYRDADFDILNIGLPDRFVEHGDIPSLRKECGIDAASVAKKIIERLNK